jgi:hypothetical protein
VACPVVAALVVLSAVGAVDGGAASAAARSVFPVAGSTLLVGVACVGALDCVAVGQGGTQEIGEVVTSGTSIGKLQKVANTNELLSVACPTPTSCVAVGVGNQASEGVIVPIKNEVAGGANLVDQTAFLHGVACSSATVCVAVGWQVGNYNGGNGRIGAVVPIVNGSAGGVELISGTLDLDGVSCAGTSCIAVGTGAAGDGAIVPITTGTAGAAHEVSSASTLESVSCPTASRCAAAGGTKSSSNTVGAVLPIKDGSPGSLNQVPGGGTLWGISCASVNSCWAVGSGGDAGTKGGYAPVGGGTGGGFPGHLVAEGGTSRLYGVACTGPNSCVAAGQGPPLGSGPGVIAAFGDLAGPWKRRDMAAAALDMLASTKDAVTYCTPHALGLAGFGVGVLMIGSAGILAVAGEITAFATEPFCVAVLKRVATDYRRINDPPDARYRHVVGVPKAPMLAPPSCAQWSGTLHTFCEQLAPWAVRWAQAAQSVAADSQALATTQARESAALAAGDSASAKLQDAQIPKFEQREAKALAAQASAGKGMGQVLQSHGVGWRITVAQCRTIVSAVERALAKQSITTAELNKYAKPALKPRAINVLAALLQG